MLTARQRKTKLKFRRDILNIGRCAWSVLMIWAGFLLHGLLTVSNTIDLQSSEMVIEVSKNRPTLAKETHWCIVASKFLPKNTRAHFSHFPHAAEIILPCWSYFMEQEATGNCGFYFANEKQFQLSPWPKDLIQAMGCEVKYPSPGKGMDKKGFVDELPKNDVQFIPNTYLLRPRLEYIRYLNSPSHAHALRRLFVSDDYIWSKKGNGKPLQIGMIQRGESRRIGNFDEIKDGIQEAIPSADIICTNFQFNTVKEQAEWFATKDVVVAAHGAALTNSVFVTPGTIIMQMYPPGYFWQSLDPLIEQSGGHAIQWYKKGGNPAVEAGLLDNNLFNIAGKATFSPPIDEVVQPLLYTLGIERPTGMKIKKLFGDWM